MRSWPEACKPLEDLERAGLVSEPPRLGAAPIPEHESEKAFQAAVVKLAKRHGWRTFHVYDMRKSQAGWPDLFLCRGPVAIAAELKVGDNKLTADQLNWLEALAATGIKTFVWTPESWAEIEQILSGPIK